MDSITDVLATNPAWNSGGEVIGVVQARADDRCLVLDVAILAEDLPEAKDLFRQLWWGLGGCAREVNDRIHEAFDGAIPSNATVSLVNTFFCGTFSRHLSPGTVAYRRHLIEAFTDVQQIGKWNGRPVFSGRLPFQFFGPNYPDPLSSAVSNATQSVDLPISKVLCRTYWESPDTVVVDSTIRVVPLVPVPESGDEDLTKTPPGTASR